MCQAPAAAPQIQPISKPDHSCNPGGIRRRRLGSGLAGEGCAKSKHSLLYAFGHQVDHNLIAACRGKLHGAKVNGEWHHQYFTWVILRRRGAYLKPGGGLRQPSPVGGFYPEPYLPRNLGFTWGDLDNQGEHRAHWGGILRSPETIDLRREGAADPSRLVTSPTLPMEWHPSEQVPDRPPRPSATSSGSASARSLGDSSGSTFPPYSGGTHGRGDSALPPSGSPEESDGQVGAGLRLTGQELAAPRRAFWHAASCSGDTPAWRCIGRHPPGCQHVARIRTRRHGTDGLAQGQTNREPRFLLANSSKPPPSSGARRCCELKADRTGVSRRNSRKSLEPRLASHIDGLTSGVAAFRGNSHRRGSAVVQPEARRRRLDGRSNSRSSPSTVPHKSSQDTRRGHAARSPPTTLSATRCTAGEFAMLLESASPRRAASSSRVGPITNSGRDGPERVPRPMTTANARDEDHPQTLT